MVSDEEDIRQSLHIILSTRLGERVMRSEFGSEVHNMVYHNMDVTARTQLRAAIENAILHFERRITLTDVEFDVSEERVGKMSIILEWNCCSVKSAMSICHLWTGTIGILTVG